ncbi:ArsR/SmtB family transcription factor [Rubrobacter calidifluminis]|uniref:ArsR/SmtB family transcription factor n=1 Tax=Rubrobacter calidifluminis TaxID=1392640 RepID=UPI002361338A|nr:metalloregulator ArsR/SmtB family transcription factor [Rubrobacter calidifluminis]
MNRREHREFKDLLYEQFARVGKALASPRRLEMIDLLAQGERTVEEIARQMELPVANVSQHLQVLRRARLVEARREGLYVRYRLADGRVFELWRMLREIGEERLAEIDRLVGDYLEDRASLEEVSAEELREMMRGGEVVVLDVRPEEEYRAGHIAGARSLPVEELEERLERCLRDLPPDRRIVAYCRGPYCVFSDEAVEMLRERGYSAVRLAEGFPEWRAAGFPVETSWG